MCRRHEEQRKNPAAVMHPRGAATVPHANSHKRPNHLTIKTPRTARRGTHHSEPQTSAKREPKSPLRAPQTSAKREPKIPTPRPPDERKARAKIPTPRPPDERKARAQIPTPRPPDERKARAQIPTTPHPPRRAQSASPNPHSAPPRRAQSASPNPQATRKKGERFSSRPSESFGGRATRTLVRRAIPTSESRRYRRKTPPF